MTPSAELLDDIRALVGDAQLRCGKAVAALDPGWDHNNLGAGILVTPGSASEVAAVMRLCHRHGVPVVPQGGRTGLVGGGISQPGEIILGLGRLNRIERLDPVERVAVVEAGVTLQALQEAAAAHGLEPGIDLAARGSATIGGMVSTNAGGVMAFRNGVMRHRVLGLEAVLADGSVYCDLTRVVKNTAGYDLKHLFIGAEGTLGIVTRIVVKLDVAPRATATALFGFASVAAALATIRRALDAEAGYLRAAEGLWRSYLQLTAHAHGWSVPAFDMGLPVYLLLSLGGAEPERLHSSFERLFEVALEGDPKTSGIIASSVRQESELWRLREDTDSLYRRHPRAPSYDVSVPPSELESYVGRILEGLGAVEPDLAPYLFGHLADGNLHIVLNRAGPLAPHTAAAVEAVLYGDLASLGGSFSAEHGVGSKRIHSLFATTAATKLAAMARIKDALDPGHLLNPGKVLPGKVLPKT